MDLPNNNIEIGLRAALAAALPQFADVEFEPLADKGLAHWHLRLIGTGLLARIPKQSQMQLGTGQNLIYQQACFARASVTGFAPRVHMVLPPDHGLARGALIVEEIVGRNAQLPRDMSSIATALAALHSLDLPIASVRPPLLDSADPLADLLEEIKTQAKYLDPAHLNAAPRDAIEQELTIFAKAASAPKRPAKALVAFDAHPGNFVISQDRRAILVDLEKARYSYPPLDLAHATLYTSTTWDAETAAELSIDETVAAYHVWTKAMGERGHTWHGWHVPLRRAMWLWSITWCAKWRVINATSATQKCDGEDWSAENSDAALITHVRNRVDCYLSPAIITQVREEFAALGDRLRE